MMDPKSLPSNELRDAVLHFDCAYCGREAGLRCKSASGENYDERTYAHLDRLSAMWRDAYAKKKQELEPGSPGWNLGLHDGWHSGWGSGRNEGWKSGALDARYTFENTPILPGARESDSLRGQMEAAGLTTDALHPETDEDEAAHDSSHLRALPAVSGE